MWDEALHMIEPCLYVPEEGRGLAEFSILAWEV